MKKLVVAGLVLGLLDPIFPPFIPNTWANIEPVEWQPVPWPGLDVTLAELPEPLAPGEVQGLVGQRIINDYIHLQARFMTVPGTFELNSANYGVVKSAIAGREASTGEAYTPQIQRAGAGLEERDCVRGSTLLEAIDIVTDTNLAPSGQRGTAVVCDIVLASGSVLGQRLRTVESQDGQVLQDFSQIVYQDTTSGASFMASEIWGEGAAQYVWDALVAVLKRENNAVGLSWVSGLPDEELTNRALDTTLVTADGTLLVTFGPGVTSSELEDLGIEPTTGDVTISLPDYAASTVLSELGANLVANAATGAAFAPAQYVWPGADYVDCKLVPCVALTYDDGPSSYTPGILDAFAAHGGAATFFVLGQLVVNNQDTVARAVNEGHLVHNHSWSHLELTLQTNEEVAKQINQTNTAIYEATGIVPSTFRPPYGSVNESVLNIAQMPAILWDVDTNDWQGPAEDVLISRIVDFAQPGSIVLQHDIHANTANTIWPVLEILKSKGFTLVNLEQLFGGALPSSGIIHRAD